MLAKFFFHKGQHSFFQKWIDLQHVHHKNTQQHCHDFHLFLQKWLVYIHFLQFWIILHKVVLIWAMNDLSDEWIERRMIWAMNVLNSVLCSINRNHTFDQYHDWIFIIMQWCLKTYTSYFHFFLIHWFLDLHVLFFDSHTWMLGLEMIC